MNAKEMFEQLGWEQKILIQDSHKVIEYGVYFDRNAEQGKGIIFYTYSKYVEFAYVGRHYYDDVNIDIPLMLAITQQMKELGWISA